MANETPKQPENQLDYEAEQRTADRAAGFTDTADSYTGLERRRKFRTTQYAGTERRLNHDHGRTEQHAMHHPPGTETHHEYVPARPAADPHRVTGYVQKAHNAADHQWPAWKDGQLFQTEAEYKQFQANQDKGGNQAQGILGTINSSNYKGPDRRSVIQGTDYAGIERRSDRTVQSKNAKPAPFGKKPDTK